MAERTPILTALLQDCNGFTLTKAIPHPAPSSVVLPNCRVGEAFIIEFSRDGECDKDVWLYKEHTSPERQ